MGKILNYIEAKSKFIPFDKLPVAEKTCFCFPLKFGSLIVSILCIIIAIGVVVVNIESTQCYPGIDVKVIKVFSVILHVTLLLASIFFIYGIIKKVANATTMFLLALLLVMIFTLIEAIVWLFTRNSNPTKCPRTFVFSGALLMRMFMYSYFLVIVNSYRVYLSANRDEIIRQSQERTDNINRSIRDKIEQKF